ncbi:MAG: DEAD/DEAH box helicase, partial [Thermoguttaceae bacterium]|nr:DEAD/DEAH box helicase [Thermoguttaceae bacterium]
MKLEEIKVGDRIEGLVPEEIATIIQTVPSGDDALTLYYSTASRPVDQQVIYREAAEQLKRAEGKEGYKFDAEGDEFKLGLEALRLSLGACVDPMIAVESSKVDPYPHQIQAVYGEMLPRRPLRFVLADDPGAGKTIMAGLLIKEMTLRDDARRVLVVAPGALVEQWQDELNEKFDLPFDIFSAEMRENSRTGNPFNEHPLLVAKLDQVARNYQGLIEAAQEWDLVIIDEAHKCSPASTTRYPLAELLGDKCRHFLLMTATPHNGKEEDFRRWMALLDSDRFSGKARDNLPIQFGDVMRRMVKEDLRKFDGSPLFPPRCAYSVNYDLSDQEMALYEHVTAYVRDEMNRADTLEGPRRGRVGFALTILQRRLASSPEAIYQS